MQHINSVSQKLGEVTYKLSHAKATWKGGRTYKTKDFAACVEMLCDQGYGEVVEDTSSLTYRSLRPMPGDSTNSKKQPVCQLESTAAQSVSKKRRFWQCSHCLQQPLLWAVLNPCFVVRFPRISCSAVGSGWHQRCQSLSFWQTDCRYCNRSTGLDQRLWLKKFPETWGTAQIGARSELNSKLIASLNNTQKQMQKT